MGFTIGVVGASGGVGASTLTAALAVRARTVVDDCRLSVAVDLDVRGGLDTTLCMEHIEGTRWSDVDDDVWPGGPDEGLLRLDSLPGEDGVFVLAGRGMSGPDPRMVLESLEAVASEVPLVAVDCGPRPSPPVLSRLDQLVVVSRLTPRGASDARALTAACPLDRAQPVLVSRGAKADRDGPSAARHLGIPFLAHLADDPRVPRHARAGVTPGVLRSAVDAVADEVLAMADSSWLQSLVSRLSPASDSVRSG